jgi:hypothetical protein
MQQPRWCCQSFNTCERERELVRPNRSRPCALCRHGTFCSHIEQPLSHIGSAIGISVEIEKLSNNVVVLRFSCNRHLGLVWRNCSSVREASAYLLLSREATCSYQIPTNGYRQYTGGNCNARQGSKFDQSWPMLKRSWINVRRHGQEGSKEGRQPTR